MTFSKIKTCIELGLCTWEQVQNTLVNAGMAQSEIADFIDGSVEMGRQPQAMLNQLIETGMVPAQAVPDCHGAEVSRAGDDEYLRPQPVELLYCLNVLRAMPSSAPPAMSDAMFGTYRHIPLSQSWVRERFGECDPYSGPHRFFAYHVFDDDRSVAVVWARDEEVGDELLKAQLRVSLDLHGELSLRRSPTPASA